MAKKETTLALEIAKTGRIVALVAALVIIPFIYRKVPLPYLLGGIVLAVLSSFLTSLRIKKEPLITLEHPLFYLQALLYLGLISMAIYFTGGLKSGLFLLYGLLSIYIAISVRISHLVGFFLIIGLAYFSVTFPEWRGSAAAISLVGQRLILLFLLSLFTALLRRKIADERIQVEKTKEDLLSTVSHELRAPLTSILGYVSLLLGEKAGSITEKQKKFLHSVLEQGKKLESLVSNILNAARPEIFLEEKEILPFNLTKLVKEAVEKFQPVAQERNLSLKTELPEVPVALQGDASKIEQVLTNLIDNALKYTEKGGVLTKVEPQEKEVLVAVKDTGPGIAKEHLPYIFEKFYQVDGSLDRAKGGTGLGLSIAQEIVKSRGGKIWIDTEEGKGTTFSFTLPLRRVGEGERESK